MKKKKRDALPEVAFAYQPLTSAQAEELTDRFISTDDDGAAWAFVRLLNGLVSARFDPHGDVESLARVAAQRAYSKTIHAEESFDLFAMTGPRAGAPKKKKGGK